MEDTVKEMRIKIGEDEDSDDEHEDDNGLDDLLDDHDRQIDIALHEANMPSTSTDSDVCTNPRRDLTEHLQYYDTNYLDSVLPLP